MHAKDNTELGWTNNWSCSVSSNVFYRGYDYMDIGIFYNSHPKVTGFWCDIPKTACYLGRSTGILVDRSIGNIFISWWIDP